VKRSLPALLLALCSLAACSDDPPGKMEPIPRPEGYVEPPKPEAPKKPAQPAPDPNKVTLRWKLAPKIPVAFRLTGTPEGGSAKLSNSYVLERPESGDLILRVATEGVAPTDQGTFSERGFILDGLTPIDRTTATLWLELPRDPVGVGDKWSLGADPVDPQALGPTFVQKTSNRRTSATLTALAPEGDERVATIEYDVYERISGVIELRAPSGGGHSHGPPPTAPKKDAKKDAKKDDDHHEEPKPPPEMSFEVSFTGRGEFLVNAGRWRSWQGTLTSKTEGYTPKSPEKTVVQVPPGSFKLQLTALDSVPPELQPAAKK
jgi:hypothetical protein